MTGDVTHASIIPLIGGETIASERVFGDRPRWISSYEAFRPNDQHLLSYYDNEVPYHLIDRNEHPKESVDVIGTICPCAGLSMIHNKFGSDNPHNDWMFKTTEYVLGSLKPRVFWGENAPLLFSKGGKGVRDKLYEIARRNDYVMSVFKTRSLLHGVP